MKDFDFWAHQNSLSIFFLVPNVYFSNCNAGISFHSVMQNTFLSFEKLDIVYKRRNPSRDSARVIKNLIYKK
ncbi:hypothetical protein C8J95_10814 [Elizabethkingia sp. YR214]|nr:hypothetical protein C8J95_10814 [Elizabethkingia sp. YR214]